MDTKKLSAAILKWGKANGHKFSKAEVLDLIEVIEKELNRKRQAKIDEETDRRIWELTGDI